MKRHKLTEAEIRAIQERQDRANEIDALLWFVTAQRELKTPPDPMKRRQPHILRHQSAEQRIADGLTKDPIRAIYSGSSEEGTAEAADNEVLGYIDVDASNLVQQNVRMLGTDATFTREVGPGDVYNDLNYRTGKSTRTQNGGGAKTTRRGSRANGGGTNTKNLEQLMSEYDDIF